jgi:hypothetical protein
MPQRPSHVQVMERKDKLKQYEQQPGPIAMWAFIYPSWRAWEQLKMAISWLKFEEKFPIYNMAPAAVSCLNSEVGQGGMVHPRIKITRADLENLKLEAGKVKGCNGTWEEVVTLVPQHHGQRVRLRPGWIHMVLNLRHSIKLSVETLVEHDLRHIAVYNRLFGCRLFGAYAAEDYTNVFVDAEAKLLQFVDKLPAKTFEALAKYLL